MPPSPHPDDAPGLRVFISYRREDAQSYARQLYHEITTRLPGGQVFWDIGTIAPGLDFVEEIQHAVGSCDVLLALIGRDWLDSRDSNGERRLDNPKDFVRLEIATALERNVRVIPVLVQGTSMPTEEVLPQALKGMARRHATELSDSRWEFDVEQLTQALRQVKAKPLEPPTGRPPTRASAVAAFAGGAATAAQVPAAQSNSGSRAPLVIGGVIAALVVLAAVGFVFAGPLLKGQTPTPEPMVAPTAKATGAALVAAPTTPPAATAVVIATAAPTLVPTAVVAATLAPPTVAATPTARPAGAAPTAIVSQAIPPQTGTFKVSVVHGFDSADGSRPQAALVQASDGNFYGTTSAYGDDGNGCKEHACAGTVFKLTPQGQYTVLHTFAFPYGEGSTPTSGLVEGPDGYLYGTASMGGATGRGTIYKISKAGDVQKLHDFCQPKCGSEDEYPRYGLALGHDGNFYGNTDTAIFRITPSGDLQTVFTYTDKTGNGVDGGLMMAADGNLYGASKLGVYRVTPDGQASLIHTFDQKNNEGQGNGELIQAKDGNLYGVAHTPSNVFRIGLDGTYKQVHLMSPNTEGLGYLTTLLQANDGSLWTETTGGGSRELGSVFALTTEGVPIQTMFWSLKTIGGTSGTAPLIQGTDGKLYGTMSSYGTRGDGTQAADGTVFVVDAGYPQLAPGAPPIR